MARPNAPVWMHLVAAAFLAYALLTNYCWFLGVEQPAPEPTIVGNGVLGATPLGSPAIRAGLQQGDRIRSANGQPVRGWGDWLAVRANLEIGRPIEFEVERGADRHRVTLTPERRGFWRSVAIADLVGIQVARLFILAVAFVIAFLRPREPLARLGALFLAIVSACDVGMPPGFAAAWRKLPLFLGAALWIPHLSIPIGGAVGLTFFRAFPRTDTRRAWVSWLTWLPALLAAVPWTLFQVGLVYRPDQVTGRLPAWWGSAWLPLLAGYACLAAVVLALKYRRLADANDLRKVRLVTVGFLVAVVPQLPYLLQLQLPALRPLVLTVPYAPIRNIAFAALPLSFAYAILRHRLFDIRFIVRRTAQYALARTALLSIVPVLLVVLVADVAWHGDQPLREVLLRGGWAYVVLTAIAVVALYRRRQWLEALDRRFFRERHDTRRVLEEIVGQLGTAETLGSLAPVVVSRIDAAFHPEFAAVWAQADGQPDLRIVDGASAGDPPVSLHVSDHLVGQLRRRSGPLDLSDDTPEPLGGQLTREEIGPLRGAGINLLVPVSARPGHPIALLGLGHRRSEEPYSLEDKDLLSALAASLGLLVQRTATAPAAAVTGPGPVGKRHTPPPRTPFLVGPWRVDPDLDRVSRDGVVKHVEPKAIEVLVWLADRAPDVVSKEALIEGVWTGTFVVEESLKRVISELRKVLEDDARRPRVIETIPKRGYRIIAPVSRGGPIAQPANGDARGKL